KGESFEDVARNFSEDPSAKQNGGNLGYFTAMQMVYPFENTVYNTPVGEISLPVRTRFGYHVVKVFEKRPARGQIMVAHIMVAHPGSNSTAQDSTAAKSRIDEIYAKYKSGESFA